MAATNPFFLSIAALLSFVMAMGLLLPNGLHNTIGGLPTSIGNDRTSHDGVVRLSTSHGSSTYRSVHRSDLTDDQRRATYQGLLERSVSGNGCWGSIPAVAGKRTSAPAGTRAAAAWTRAEPDVADAVALAAEAAAGGRGRGVCCGGGCCRGRRLQRGRGCCASGIVPVWDDP